MIDKIVQDLVPRFKGLEIMFFQGEEKIIARCQSQLSGGIAMKIRNEFRLWVEDSSLRKWFDENTDLKHPDDMSGYILKKVYQAKKKEMENEV